jgi:CpeT protein
MSQVSKLCFFLVIACLAGSCASTSTFTATSTKELSGLDKFTAIMAGSYSSEAQSIQDSAFFDIRLEMVPIWKEREDGNWLYVEQAAAGYLDRPYRQRVYHITQDAEGIFRSAVLTLPEPIRFAGKYNEISPLGNLTPDSLSLREGCDIVLSKQEDGSFKGGTGDKTCSSKLRGASWASSKVDMFQNQLISWDQGWDAQGSQVWGAENSGYIFKKLTAK